MIRSLFFYFSLATALFAATGSILSPVVVRTDGWTADITIEGMLKSGTYDFGWTSRIRGNVTSGTFQAGETITQTGSGATSKAWGPADNDTVTNNDFLWAYTYNITGTPNSTGTWVGGTSGAVFTPTELPVSEYIPSRSTPKVVFTVVSHGYNDSCVLTTRSRTVYGTRALRYPFPDQATNQETEGGGNVTVRICLSDLIYEKDNVGASNSGTAPVVNILAGFYNQGVNSSLASGAGFTVANSSTAQFREGVWNWVYPPFQLVTAGTRLRMVAFHKHATQGRPFRAIKFTATDGITTNSEIVTTMTRGHDFGDAVKVVEYVTTGSLVTGLTQGATITFNAEAYPWVGDNPMYTSTGATGVTPQVGPITGVCDRLGSYGRAFAVVDPAAGVDPASEASDTGAWLGGGTDPGTGTGLTPYKTVARASRGIYNYNLANRGRGDVGGGLVYLLPGTWVAFGNTVAGGYGTTPGTWLTIKPFPGINRAECPLVGSLGNTNISDRVKLENIEIDTTTGNTFSGCDAMWLDNCDLNSTAAGTWNSNGQVVWLTGGRVGTFTQGFKAPSSAVNMSFALLRGLDLTAFNGTVNVYTVVGNLRAVNAPGGPAFVSGVAGQVAPFPVPILAYNKLYGYDVSSGLAVFRFGHLNSATPVKGAVVQNLIETSAGSAGGVGNICSSESVTGNTPVDDIIYWYNTHVGSRMQFAYNSSGSTLKYRRYWSIKGNYWDISAHKSDTFTGSGGGNGARIGAWMVGFGVGSEGNLNGNVSAIASVGFDFDFLGLGGVDTRTANALTYPQFVDRRSYTGSAGLGVGDYHIAETSPLAVPQIDWYLPYDLDGSARDLSNAAMGVYVSGTAGGSTDDFPVVTITSPSSGATQASPVSFAGTATDTEDGTISANIVWTSNVNGTLGTGASISASLSPGTHTITATITDSFGQIDTDSITMTISAPPSGTTLQGNRVNADNVNVQ